MPKLKNKNIKFFQNKQKYQLNKKFFKFRKKEKLKDTLFSRKKFLLFFKRKLYYYKDFKFNKSLIIRVKANNVFCTFNNNNNDKKTIFSCAASRYKIKITAKRLKYQIARILTFFYQDIKTKIKSRYLVIKIIAPQSLRVKLYYLCIRLFSKLKIKQKIEQRSILYYIKDYKSFNGCRVKKKRRKKRRRSFFLKHV